MLVLKSLYSTVTKKMYKKKSSVHRLSVVAVTNKKLLFSLPDQYSVLHSFLLCFFFFEIQGKSTKATRDSVVHRSEMPILAAERKIFKEQRESGKQPVYVPDRINRKSTYKKDFVDYKKQSKNPQKSKPKRQHSPHKIVGGKKEGINYSG